MYIVRQKSTYLFLRNPLYQGVRLKAFVVLFRNIKMNEKVPIDIIALCLVIFSMCVFVYRPRCERSRTEDKFLFPEVN
jgi:hypothetical protein